jgi:hypothetical protein
LLSVIWKRVWRVVAVDLDMVTTFFVVSNHACGVFRLRIDAENPALDVRVLPGWF